MEIRHTVEILTKDIQEIENLVRNLNNYKTPPRIEIDLAMSKLRNVYELLAMISRDMRFEEGEASPADVAASRDRSDSPMQQEKNQPVRSESEEEQLEEVQTAAQEQPVEKKISEVQQPAEEKPIVQEQPVEKKISELQQPAEKRISEEQSPEEVKSAAQEKSSEEGSVIQEKPATERSAEKEQPSEEKKKEEVRKASILAEKFAADRSINEKIAPGNGTDLTSRLTGDPIDSIKRHIGINDRFMIIRERLEGNNAAYSELLQQLDTKNNFDEAYQLIEDKFPDHMEHDGVNLLVRLSRRRYLSR